MREAPALQLRHGRWAAARVFCTGTLWAANGRACTCAYARQAEGGSAPVVSLARLLASGGCCDPVQFTEDGSGRCPALAWCNAAQQPFAGSGGIPGCSRGWRSRPEPGGAAQAGGRAPALLDSARRPGPATGYRPAAPGSPPRGSGPHPQGRGWPRRSPLSPRSCKKGVENAARALRLP